MSPRLILVWWLFVCACVSVRSAHSWVCVSISATCVFLGMATWTANLPGRWDLPDTLHRYTSRVNLQLRHGPRDRAHALSQQSTRHAVVMLALKVVLGWCAVAFSVPSRGHTARAVGAWMSAATSVAMAVASINMPPFATWKPACAYAAVVAACACVFVCSAVLHTCAALNPEDYDCSTVFGSLWVFLFAAIVGAVSFWSQVRVGFAGLLIVIVFWHVELRHGDMRVVLPTWADWLVWKPPQGTHHAAVAR